MKVDFNKKYDTISVYCVLTFAVCLALVIVCMRSAEIFGYIKQFFKVIAPVIWGIVIAYIGNPVMMFCERLLKKLIDKKKPHPKLTRMLSVLITVSLLIAVIVSLVTLVVIQVRDSLMEILNSIPLYIKQLEELAVKLLGDYPDAVKFLESQLETVQPKLMDYANGLLTTLGDNFIKVKDGAMVVVVALKDFIIGFIVAIYLLISKETFAAQSRKLIYALFSKSLSKGILQTCSTANQMLSGFLSGKLLDSFLIGVICFVVMRIANWEFVALISVIVGITNMIPFFGPFFGAVPSALLLLMTNPKHVIPFVIFIIILQQFDGNILGPKILGDSTGLSPFWVMFAIFVGGGLFDFAGMLLGVPVFAVIYALVCEFLEYLLKRKRLSHLTEDYMCLDPQNPPAAKPSVPQTEEKAAAAESK